MLFRRLILPLVLLRRALNSMARSPLRASLIIFAADHAGERSRRFHHYGIGVYWRKSAPWKGAGFQRVKFPPRNCFAPPDRVEAAAEATKPPEWYSAGAVGGSGAGSSHRETESEGSGRAESGRGPPSEHVLSFQRCPYGQNRMLAKFARMKLRQDDL